MKNRVTLNIDDNDAEKNLSKSMELRADHPFVGVWVTEEEDSDASFTVSVVDGQFRIQGVCISDGEAFEINNVGWADERLSFHALMPSTGVRSINVFQLLSDGKAELALTIYEVWKKIS
jgi:hypothetical protein